MINITDRLNVSPVHCPIAPAVASPHAPAQPRQHQRALVDVTRKAGFPHLNSKYLYSLWAITNPYDCQRIYHQFRKTSVKIHKKKITSFYLLPLVPMFVDQSFHDEFHTHIIVSSSLQQSN